MSVLAALEEALEKMPATPLEAEIARALATALDSKDNGQGKASTGKELRALLAEIELRKDPQQVDGLDELANKRAARRSG